MTTPRVSILMAVYNGRRFLREAMASVQAQTFTDFELLVIDDGSTDGSGELLRQYAEHDARVKVTRQENAGLTVSLNRLAKKASAPLLARMDPDDVCHRRRLERQVKYLDAHPEIVALGTGIERIDEYGTPLGSDDTRLTHAGIDEQLMRGIGSALCHPTVVVRRSAFDEVGGYDERYRTCQDLDLFLRLAEVGRLANLPDVLLEYRQHLESANKAKAAQQVANCRAIVREAAARRGVRLEGEPVEDWPVVAPEEQLLTWGWVSLRERRRRCAAKYALRVLGRRPTRGQAYKLLACAVRGR